MSAGLGFGPVTVPFDPEQMSLADIQRMKQAGVAAPAPQAGIATMIPTAPDLPLPQPEAAAPSLAGAPLPVGLGFGSPPQAVPPPAPVPPAPKADLPAPGAVPTMAPPSVAPAPPAAPATAPAASAAAPAGPDLGDRLSAGLARFRDRGGFDYLGAIGAGLLSSPRPAAGVALGLQLAQKSEAQRAATDLARAELGLKTTKLRQETAVLGGNASFVKNKIPGISDDQAAALGSNSGFMTELAKGVIPPTELYKQFNDPETGNEYNVNSRTGQKTLIVAGKDDKAVTTIPESERVSLGLPAGSYQRDTNGKITPINPTGTTINMGAEKEQDKVVGKGYGEYQIDLATKGRNAGSTLNTLALMEQAARNPNFYSGVGAEHLKRANQFAVALGIKDANYTKPTEVFDALSNKVVLDGLGGSLGPGISNTDRDYIGRTAPTLQRTPEGNLELIGIARTLGQRQQQVSKLARDYAAKNGRLDAGFDQALEDFATQNPLFPAASASSTKVSDGATGATGAGGLAAPKTQAEFDALPSGAVYIDPNTGKKYRK